MEFIPCDVLKPYIKCFWGTTKPVEQQKASKKKSEIIIPDTCMDIIFDVDFTNNKIQNTFCGINDRILSIVNSIEEKMIFTFGIRFYAWGAVLFSEDTLKNTCDAFYDVGYHFEKIKREIESLLFDATDIRKLIYKVEKILVKHCNLKLENTYVYQAVSEILQNRGNIRTEQLTKELHVSSRQLERVFLEYVGVSPKKLASMMRYQYLWNDILFSQKFDLQEAVWKYGYSDQAHLLHDFKRFHSMNITEAKKYALKYVAFLQE